MEEIELSKYRTISGVAVFVCQHWKNGHRAQNGNGDNNHTMGKAGLNSRTYRAGKNFGVGP
jgi:hypothetical protein